ncbi:hypothetical protein GUJ93_ZPchr0007g3255 [Zizania palustris]|uniref:NAC domain-containing protein n=1 Tax=Zizania palustris TaxID=103762 RepID=A0A8J5T030_ZIZPA|nr:hypothetical protein GUJ93_ZPchr0007g3255 [Zizania palustris]
MSYLRTRVESSELTWPYVHEVDVYAADPEDLTRDFSPAIVVDSSVAWYFFTNMRSKRSYGQRKVRMVETGEGSWHAEGAAECVVTGVHRDREVGRRHTFSFGKKEDDWTTAPTSSYSVRCTKDHGRRSLLLPTVKKSTTAEETPTPKDTKSAVASAQSPDTKILTEAEEAQTPMGTKPAEKSTLARGSKIPTAVASETKKTNVDVAAAATGCTRMANGKNSGAGKVKQLPPLPGEDVGI